MVTEVMSGDIVVAAAANIMIRAVVAEIAAKVMARTAEAEHVANDGCNLSRSGQDCGRGGQGCRLV